MNKKTILYTLMMLVLFGIVSAFPMINLTSPNVNSSTINNTVTLAAALTAAGNTSFNGSQVYGGLSNWTFSYCTTPGTSCVQIGMVSVVNTTMANISWSGISSLTDRNYTINVSGIYAANNTNRSELMFWIEVDDTAPTTISVSPVNNVAVGATVTLLNDESDATCRYDPNNVNYADMDNVLTTGSTVTFTNPVSRGEERTYYVRCQDAHGNTETTSANFRISNSEGGASGGGGFIAAPRRTTGQPSAVGQSVKNFFNSIRDFFRSLFRR